MTTPKLTRTVVLLALAAALSLPAPAADAGALTVQRGEHGTRLSVGGEPPFHRTANRISAERLVAVPGSTTRVVLWSETDPSGEVTPFYAVGLDGAEIGAARSTSYVVKLRHGNFDPARGVPDLPRLPGVTGGGRLYLVQYVTQPLEDYRSAIAALGGRTLGFVPDHTEIVRMGPAVRERVASLPFVRWVGPYAPAHRLEPFLLDNRDRAAELYPRLKVNILVFETGDDAKQAVARRIRAMGGTVDRADAGKFLLEATLTPSQLYQVASFDEVQFIDRWSPMEKDMDIVREIGGSNYLESVAGYTGAGVRAEIFDAGFNLAHPDFQSRPLIEHGGTVGNDSHGTATAGINFGDGTGDARARGLMPDGQGIVADYNNVGLTGANRYTHTGELLEDPYHAVFQTSSVGSARTFDYTTISADHDTLLFDWDVLHCQSQSNAGNQDSRPQAWAKNVVSGGAFNHYDTATRADDCWCSTGSIGPASDGRIKPDLSFFYDDTYTTYSTGPGYGEFGGTSGATPSICGHFGLFFEMWSDGIFGNDVDPGGTVFDNRPHMTTAKAFLINTADQAEFSGTTHDMTRVHQGWGMPSVRNLWDLRDKVSFVDESFLLANLETVEFNAIVDPGEPALRVTMTYADPAGNPAASEHQVNDLTLRVTSPSGTEYWGNHGLLAEMWSSPGGAADTIDTVENVFVQNPEAGTWLVEVTADEINQDGHVETPELDADFALVVSGAFMPACTSDGAVSFNRAKYACEDEARVRVVDCDLNADDNVVETVTVSLTSDSEPGGETVVLTETAAASATFQTLVPLSETDAEGVVQVAAGDTVTAEYVDADDGAGGTNVSKTKQATIDCTEPLISGVGETGVDDVSATVVWTTDEPAGTELVWGEVVPPTTSKTKAGTRTSHAVALTGLTACTVYHYEVRSLDPYGNLAVDDNGGNYYHFETMGDFGSGLQPCHEGQVSIDRSVLSCADTMTFEVVDLDLNADPLVAETATLFVTSTTEAVAEPVVVTETGVNTSVFAGAIATTSGTPASDGLLQTADGDLLTLTYHDEDDGAGSPSLSFATATADCGGPTIRSLRVTSVTDQRFTVEWDTDEPATAALDWGKTPALPETIVRGSAVTHHAVVLNQFDACGQAYLRVHATDVHGNSTTADLGGQPHRASTGRIPGLYWQETFEHGVGAWSLSGEWEIGGPQGNGGSSGSPDPSSAWNNAGALGHDLSGQGAFPGDYEPNTLEHASSPTLDATTWTNTKLIMTRRVNVHDSDTASLWLQTDAARPLYVSDGTVNETGYQVVPVSLGALVDGQPAVRLDFRQQADGSVQYAGWNVDDIIFKDGNLPDYGACADCSAEPSFAGAVSAVDNDACGASGVTVSWNAAFSWGSGQDGTYAVYRDVADGFTPSPANRIASGLAGLSFVDLAAPVGQPSYYLVRAESDETCGAGPNNGGVTDSGAVTVQAIDTDDQPAPGAIVDATVSLVNDVHVRVSWTAPPGASSYRVYRSTDPQPGTFLLLGETTATFLDDETSGANANSYFYQVVAVNACGEEGP